MSWCEQLTHRPKAPSWNGPAQVYNLLSAGDEKEDDKPEPRSSTNEKLCPSCERVFPSTKEYFYSNFGRGRMYLHTKCKCCMKAEQAERDSVRRRGGKKRK